MAGTMSFNFALILQPQAGDNHAFDAYRPFNFWFQSYTWCLPHILPSKLLYLTMRGTLHARSHWARLLSVCRTVFIIPNWSQRLTFVSHSCAQQPKVFNLAEKDKCWLIRHDSSVTPIIRVIACQNSCSKYDIEAFVQNIHIFIWHAHGLLLACADGSLSQNRRPSLPGFWQNAPLSPWSRLSECR